MSVFDVDFDKTIWENLPVNERTPVRYAWLKALAASSKYIYGAFTVNRANNLYILDHDALNDTFDMTLRRIYISDPAYFDPLYVYEDAEDKLVYAYLDSEIGGGVVPLYLYTDAEVAGATAMFIVNVPHTLVYDVNRMKALIDLYRLPGRNIYLIVGY
jgi:hypothetical protein